MRRYIALFITALLVLTSPTAFAKKQDNINLNLNCKAALLMENSTGKILYEYNAHEKVYPASVTKIMVMLLTMEAVDSGSIKLSDKVVISARAKSMGGSTMFLEQGEIRTVEELLKGVAVESANDAAVALAEFLAGTEEAFVEKMNKRAKELGMKNTNFVNCTGFFDPNHYTTAYDVALMSRELLKHPKILDYTKIWMETISEGRKEPFTLVNRNKMIKSYNGCDGLKTGYVKESMYCISATASRNGLRFIAVIMGAPSAKERNEMAAKLLDVGFSKYQSITAVKKGDVVGEISLPMAKPNKVKLIANEDLKILLEKGAKVNYEIKVDLFKDLKLPIKKGEIVGIAKAVDGEKVYGQVPVVVDTDIVKVNYFDVLEKMLKLYLNIN
ncbi:D-alanyl-D-alanine carboxypeptidase (penicillin-binding protein 5/6) [Caloramator fervidus]|uniref:serine-type D-Ala-D-Ala carboxypeptidase n=1 Tax=Caloramator fervidus TaxID=29344 RepID=A0A1H5ULD1_9CLOT|nr:D-alanyl-D-alanine carboxypeptidase family protein [Caloramator fervidus]SEF75201.1 D-alanyl-D-alanine carboxypeptidase (penicillin-binding protein 5/6) [Caloramator fervidus]